jgi:hypothetical protein
LIVKTERERTKRTHRIGEKPPVSLARIIGEFLAGGAGGLTALGVVWILWFLLSSVAFRHLGEWAEIPVFICLLVVVAVTHSLGSAIGVYLVGNIGNETGSFAATWGYGFLGGIAGIGILCASGRLSVVPELLGTSIGAIIGFNLTRRYKSPT